MKRVTQVIPLIQNILSTARSKKNVWQLGYVLSLFKKIQRISLPQLWPLGLINYRLEIFRMDEMHCNVPVRFMS